MTRRTRNAASPAPRPRPRPQSNPTQTSATAAGARTVTWAPTGAQALGGQTRDLVPPPYRRSAVAWWCPTCDNSQPHTFATCGKCGRPRPAD